MRGNIKNLTLFVIVATIAMFIVVALASADPKDDNALQGQYAFTGPGNCVVSPTGFGANYVPNPPGDVFAANQIWEGVYTFSRDGSGSINAVVRSFDLPGFGLGIADITWEFKYSMTDKNRFQTWLAPGTYDKVEWTAGSNCDSNGQNCATIYFDIEGTWEGVVASDGKSISITGGPPLIHILCDPGQPPCVHIPFQAYCTESHVGTLLHD